MSWFTEFLRYVFLVIVLSVVASYLVVWFGTDLDYPSLFNSLFWVFGFIQALTFFSLRFWISGIDLSSFGSGVAERAERRLASRNYQVLARLAVCLVAMVSLKICAWRLETSEPLQLVWLIAGLTFLVALAVALVLSFVDFCFVLKVWRRLQIERNEFSRRQSTLEELGDKTS